MTAAGLMPLLAATAAVILVIALAQAVHVIPGGHAGVVLRFGRFHAVRHPGLCFTVPLVERVVPVDMRERSADTGREEVATTDGGHVGVAARVVVRTVDPESAVLKVRDAGTALDAIARAALRSAAGAASLDDLMCRRGAVADAMAAEMVPLVEQWGIHLERVDIGEVTPVRTALS